MKVIAITGGIASGKSTVANILHSNFTVPVIDSDHIAKELLLHNNDLLQELVRKFGADILLSDKTLDRKKLRTLIFQNPNDRLWLEKLLHPAINQVIRDILTNLTQKFNFPYCLILIPLVTKQYLEQNKFIDYVLVIDAERPHQITRASTRDNQPIENIENIINSQISQAERLSLAHYVIHNNGDLIELQKQALQFHDSFIRKQNI